MKTAITLTLRAFPVTIQDTRTGQTAEDRIIFTKEQLRAAALVGQSSKELISRMYNREGYKVLAIDKPTKRDVAFNLPLLCGLADGLDITADFKNAVEVHGGTVRPDSCFIMCAEGQRIQIEEFDEDGGGPVLDVPAAKNEVRA